jgi:serine/threonine protein phosphatase PrpC
MAQINVIDEISLPGSPERVNEDALGATGTIAFVLDGVTGLADSPLLSGKSDAAWVAAVARDLFLEHGPGRAGDLRALIKIVTEGIVERFERERIRIPAERYELPWTTLSIIGITPGLLHIAYLGDSRVIVETSGGEIHNFGTNPTRTAFEQRLSARVAAQSKSTGLGSEASRALVLPELRRARNTVNTTNGYWLLGADPQAAAHAGATSLALSGPATVLLTTDGFYALKDDYERFDDRDLIATSQTLGLAEMGVQLRRIENDDPDGQRFPRMKKSDDATALLVRVAP